jgi:hypothetical protein
MSCVSRGCAMHGRDRNRRVLLIRLFIIAKRPFPARLAHRHPVKESVAGIIAFIHDAIASRAIINVRHTPQHLTGWRSNQGVAYFRQSAAIARLNANIGCALGGRRAGLVVNWRRRVWHVRSDTLVALLKWLILLLAS